MSEKPFPMPGTVWRWAGNDMAPCPSGPHVVESLRWFRGRVEAIFAGVEAGDKSCVGVEHMMRLDGWEYVSGDDVHRWTLDEIRAAWERAQETCRPAWKKTPEADDLANSWEHVRCALTGEPV